MNQFIYSSRTMSVSNSLLSAFKKYLQGEPLPDANNPNFRFGRGFHQMLLEPHNFDKHEFTGREKMQFMDMIQSVKQVVDPDIFKCKKEHSMIFNHHGFRCRVIYDIYGDALVGDFKTTGCRDESDFLGSAIKYDYHRQGALYLDAPDVIARGINTFIIWAVGKAKPHPIFQYELHRDNPLIAAGRDEYIYLMDEFSKLPESIPYKIAA